ncbi:hypothetical protein [Haloferula sp. BvORR071]|uniref:hypothetical protein n=1 Tax=Haloferula sp. BvORR071 TaxID=1396141 RepID=UPI002240EA02|nr:hypothetical protein [Haloferula sp. BvORR071]
MNSGEDYSEFENQLRGMALRQPPPEWKSLLFPPVPPPLFPKPLLLGIAACWVASLGVFLATPEREDLGPPMLPPPAAEPEIMDNALAIRMENER